MELDVRRFTTFEELPSAAAVARFEELASRARQKVWAKHADLIDAEEWHCLGVMDPDTARNVHHKLREQQEQQQQHPQQKQATSPPVVQLAWPAKDEDSMSFYKRCAKMATPLRVFEIAVTEVWEFIKDMNSKNVERNDKIAALEAKVRELEIRASENKSLEYFGVFDGDQQYRRNSAVTHDGSIWISRTDNPGVPGADHSGWILAVMRGRPGRNGQDFRGNDR